MIQAACDALPMAYRDLAVSSCGDLGLPRPNIAQRLAAILPST